MSLAPRQLAKTYFRTWNLKDAGLIQNLHAANSSVKLLEGIEFGPTSEDVGKGWLELWTAAPASFTEVLDVFTAKDSRRCIVRVKFQLPADGARAEGFDLMEFDNDGLCTSYTRHAKTSSTVLHSLATKYFDVWNTKDVPEIEKLLAPGSVVKFWDGAELSSDACRGVAERWTMASGVVTKVVDVATSGEANACIVHSRIAVSNLMLSFCDFMEFDDNGVCRTCLGYLSAEAADHLKNAISCHGARDALRLVESGVPLTLECQLGAGDEDIGVGSILDLLVFCKRFKLVLQILQLLQGSADPEAIPDYSMLGEWGDEVGLLGEEPSDTKARELVKASKHALAWAAREGQAELLEALLRLGASPLQLDERKRSALLLAAMRGKKLCLQVLLQAGAWDEEQSLQEVEEWIARWKLMPSDEVETRKGQAQDTAVAQQEERWANTPHERLLWPIRRNQATAEQTIARDGVKQVEHMLSQGDNLLAEFALDAAGRDIGNALDCLLLSRRYKLAMQILQRPEGEKLAGGCTRALVWAARDGRTGLVGEMLKLGAEAGQCDEFGRSALLLAATRGRSSCVEALLAAEAWHHEACKEHVLYWMSFWQMKAIQAE
eukprot:TRINITY_DN18489_c0_g1_i1.p1 TRINITY_DN18489_c0_g1~~TRINITY_DN18489_c0_g1_i1.p1  ORF type:complete len:619 (-),score=146.38 TRINITY_DN18489_c0_g1_i1:83-1900(-)